MLAKSINLIRVGSLLGFSLFFGILIFPYAYFRGDDWLILANAVHYLPKNWNFLWQTKLVIGDSEVVWFFRPLFKLSTFLFYRWFGLNYWLWLVALLCFCVASICLVSQSIWFITRSSRAVVSFLILVTASVHLHIGSLAWVGEGLMNYPQIFFLSLMFYFASRSLSDKPTLFRMIGVHAAFLLALGFKESSVFFVVFLAGALFSVMKRREWVRFFVPLGGVALFYLVIRLGVLPMNQSYIPHWQWERFKSPLFLLGAGFSLPVFVWGLVLLVFEKKIPRFEGRASQFFYLLFFLLCIFPYFGHDFFSPGWLTYPVFFLCVWMSLQSRELKGKTVITMGTVLFLVSAGASLYEMHRIHWWLWKGTQKQALHIIQTTSPEETHRIVIGDCKNNSYLPASFLRTVGGDLAMDNMWLIIHGSRLPIRARDCSILEKNAALRSRSSLYLKFHFPEITVVP